MQNLNLSSRHVGGADMAHSTKRFA
jgi:hypothetical protein